MSLPERRPGLRRLFGVALPLLILAACEPEEPVPMGEPGEPLFRVDPDASGPLTFSELRLNFTDLDRPVSERERRCVKEAVEHRAEALGDPALYKPEDYDYHGGHTTNAEWLSFDNAMRRTLLAQVVVTYAFFDCD